MRQVITAFVAITWLFVALHESSLGQPGPMQPPQPGGPLPLPGQPGPGPGPIPGQGQQTVTIAFGNASHTPVVVKGYSIIKGQATPGQLLPMKKDGKAFETNVPANTARYYTVYDATNPTRVLLQNQRIPVLNRDLALLIKTSPLDPKTVVIVPAVP